MSVIYTQKASHLNSDIKALVLGTAGICGVFAILPLLATFPNLFDAVPIETPPTTAEVPPSYIDIEKPPPSPLEDTLELPEIEKVIPPMSLTFMEQLLNPSDNGTGVYVDMGGSFLGEDATNFGVFLTSELDKQPRVLVATQPLYPYSMQQSKTEGRVVVEFIIDQTGQVRQPRVVKSSHREFEQAAIEAVLKSKWEAGRKDGRDVMTRVQLPVNFKP